MGEWKLHVGQINVNFISTGEGALGVKFNRAKEGGKTEIYAPGLTKAELEKFNPKNPQKEFYDVRFTGDGEYSRINEIVPQYYDKEKPDVMISAAQMAEMHPLNKEAKVISKQSIAKLNLTNVGASQGYYLLPVKDYTNIMAYKKLVEYLGDDFVLTSPMRLAIRSVTTHNYAIFVDKRQGCLIAMEVLVKTGLQPEPVF